MSEYADILIDATKPLDVRIRALHELREPHSQISQSEKISFLQKTITETSSVLLLHEVMYALGQIGDPSCVDFLKNIMVDEKNDVVTRHEAGEALGAIGGEVALNALREIGRILREEQKGPQELQETCYLAVRRLEGNYPRVTPGCEYSSVDPAPPHDTIKDQEQLRALLNDASADLFERYRAMFAMRDNRDVEGLVASLVHDTSSALFRHEIAFVLGQLEDRRSVEGLVIALKRKEEHAMVRHEAAEALGAIATPACWEAIAAYATVEVEADVLVRDSCVVAQDMFKYYQAWSAANREESIEAPKRLKCC